MRDTFFREVSKKHTSYRAQGLWTVPFIFERSMFLFVVHQLARQRSH